LTDVSEVIIGPAEDDILGKIQAFVVEVQYLCVSDQHLRHAGDLLSHPFVENRALVCDDLFQDRHGDIMAWLVIFSTLAHGIDILIFSIGLNTVLPIFVDVLFVDRIVPGFAGIFTIPLCAADVVAQHGFDVRGAHDDRIVVSHLLVLLIAIKRNGPAVTIVHGRPEMVGFEPQQQLKNFCVSPWTESMPLFRCKVFHSPRTESPHLVVDEDAAIFNCRRTDSQALWRDVERLAMQRRHIGPPIPGRHPDAF